MAYSSEVEGVSWLAQKLGMPGLIKDVGEAAAERPTKSHALSLRSDFLD